MYKGSTAADAQTVNFLVKEAASTIRQEGQRGRDSGAPGSARGASAGAEVDVGQGQCSVPFGLFLQVLLGYQLHGYLRRIKVFRENFREVSASVSPAVVGCKTITKIHNHRFLELVRDRHQVLLCCGLHIERELLISGRTSWQKHQAFCRCGKFQ